MPNPNRFDYSKKGYDPAQVDNHIAILENILSEYKSKDSSIAGAILNAQMAADEIVRKANVAADTIVQNARNMALQVAHESARQVDGMLKSVKAQKERINTFKEDYQALITKYILTFDENDVSNAVSKADLLEAYLNKFLETELSDS